MKRALLWPVLYLAFCLGAFVAGCLTPILVLLYPLMDKKGQNAKRVESMDRTIAAFYFGCSGRWTLSIECAHQQRREMKTMRDMLERALPGHCEESANNENVFCDWPRK